MLKFWLDDLRQPPDESWAWARNYEEAVEFVRQCRLEGKTVAVASLDHDLSVLPGVQEKTGYDFVCHLARVDWWPDRIIVHSWNPEGGRRMGLVAAKYTAVAIVPFTGKEI